MKSGESREVFYLSLCNKYEEIIQPSISNEPLRWDTTILGTWEMINTSTRQKVKRLVFRQKYGLYLMKTIISNVRI
jgi:hypothetical protein